MNGCEHRQCGGRDNRYARIASVLEIKIRILIRVVPTTATGTVSLSILAMLTYLGRILRATGTAQQGAGVPKTVRMHCNNNAEIQLGADTYVRTI